MSALGLYTPINCKSNVGFKNTFQNYRYIWLCNWLSMFSKNKYKQDQNK